jgi:protoheme IX farnesyltransferase
MRIQILATGAALICMWVANHGEWEWVMAINLVIGLSMTSTAAAIINQVIEIDIDKRMPRTCDRPLPTGRVRKKDAILASWVLAIVGFAWLAFFLNPLSAWLAIIMIVLYDFIYTPLKRVTPLNTLVGAIPGAMPLLIGYAAAGNGLDILAGILFLILFLWQLPHFFAIAWLYRDDYKYGGLQMLPGVDKTGVIAGRQAIHYALALVPMSMAPSMFEFTEGLYFYGSLSLSLIYLATALMFRRNREIKTARIVLYTSIVYLPLLFALLVLDYRY